MKKRKLLLGVLLASAAIGLAACSGNNNANNNDDSNNSSDTGDGGQTVTNKYTVTFNTNGGSSISSVEVDEGGKVTRPATNPTKEADAENTYEFENWYKDQALTQVFNFDTETISAATTIYAKWTATPIQQATYIALNVNSTGATKEFQLGQKLDTTGIVVTAITDEGNPVTLSASQYTVSAKDPSNAAFDIANDLTVSGTYTITITAGDVSGSYTVVVKAAQYKFTVPFTADSYNASLETPYTGNDTIPAGDYTWLNNRALKVEFSCTSTNGKLQVTDSNGNSVAKTFDGTTYNSRFQINAGAKALFKLTPKVSGEIAIYFNTSATRYLIVNDASTSAKYNSEAVTDANKDSIVEHKFNVIAGHTYEITSSTNGSNVYAIKFNASVDSAERVETDKLILSGYTTEFDTDTNKFNPASANITVKASDNYDNERAVALSDCTVTVKDSSNNPVTGEITTAGEYTVTVTYAGVSESYTINVVDLNAAITAIEANTTNVQNKFYEVADGTSLNTTGLVVTGTKGGVEITLASADYTVTLKKNGTAVTAFDTTGQYTVEIASTEDPTITTSYNVNYYAVEEYTIATVFANDGEEYVTEVQTGSTKFVHNTRLAAVYHDAEDAANYTKVNVDDRVECKFYSDSACTSEISTVTAAFATAGTVYAKLYYGTQSVVVKVTVKQLTSFSWDVTKAVDPLGKTDAGSFAAGDLDNNFELIGTTATVRLASNGSKATSIELAKNLTSYVKVVLTGPATIVITASSTNDSNTTSGWGIFTDPDTKTLADGVTAQDVVGKDQTLTFTVNAAGTYYIGYTESQRNGRLQTITVTYNS